MITQSLADSLAAAALGAGQAAPTDMISAGVAFGAIMALIELAKILAGKIKTNGSGKSSSDVKTAIDMKLLLERQERDRQDFQRGFTEIGQKIDHGFSRLESGFEKLADAVEDAAKARAG